MVFTFRIYYLTSCERTLRKKKIARVVSISIFPPFFLEVLLHVWLDENGFLINQMQRKKIRAQDVESSSTLNTKHAARSNKKMRSKALMPFTDKNGEDAYFEAAITVHILKQNCVVKFNFINLSNNI